MNLLQSAILLLTVSMGISVADEVAFEVDDWGLPANARPYLFGSFGEFTVVEKVGGKIVWRGHTPKGRFDDIQVSESQEACGVFLDNSAFTCAEMEILTRGGGRYVLGYYGLATGAKEPVPEKLPLPDSRTLPRAANALPKFKDTGVRHFYSLRGGESSVVVWSSWTGAWIRWNWVSDAVSVIPENELSPALTEGMQSSVLESLRLNFPYVPLEDRDARDIVRRSNSTAFLILYHLWLRNQAAECMNELNDNSFQARTTLFNPVTITLSNEKLAFLTHLTHMQNSDQKERTRPRTAHDLEKIRLAQKQAIIRIPLSSDLKGLPLQLRGTLWQKRNEEAGRDRMWRLVSPQFRSERLQIEIGGSAAELVVQVLDLPVGVYEFRFEVLARDAPVSRLSTNIVLSADTKSVGDVLRDSPF